MTSEVLNHLWQSTVFALGAGVLTLAFRKNRAQVRYWLWLGASVKFLIPFALLVSLGSEAPRPAVVTRIAPPAVAVAIVQLAEPLPETPSPAAPRSQVPWVAIAWACGFAGVALIRLRGWVRVRAAVRASTPVKLSAAVEVRSAPGLLEPGVVGVFRPILLLPEGIAEKLTPAQLDAVLAHEMCHVRRRDNLTSAIHMLVEAVFWFHPLVWWIGARLVEERERACDEEVLRLGGDAREYADAILNICKLYVESPLTCVAGVTGADLKKRIEAIMINRILPNLSAGKKAALAAACLMAVAVPVAVGVLRAQSTAPQKFEVAAIRRGCGAGDGKSGGKSGGKGSPTPGGGIAVPPWSPGRLSTCAPLWNGEAGGRGGGAPPVGLIPDAYGRYAGGRVNPVWAIPRVEGGPDWMKFDSYAINATADAGAGEAMMRGPMMQALLEDRFQLKLHRETRETPVYELVAAKGGPKLQAFKQASCTPADSRLAPGTEPQPKPCKFSLLRGKTAPFRISAQGASLQQLAFLLGLSVDRPVVDKTGIAGLYDFDFEFGRDEAMGDLSPHDAAQPADPGPSLSTVLREQLGLKLESGKGSREVLVIDHVERPSEN